MDNQVAHNIQAGTAQLIKASNDNFNALMQHEGASDARTRQAENFRAQQQTSFEHAQQNDRAAQAAIDHSAHQMALYSLDRQTFINPAPPEDRSQRPVQPPVDIFRWPVRHPE